MLPSRRLPHAWIAAVALALIGGGVAWAQGANPAAGPTPHWTSLLPPAVAVGLALLFRQVVPALLAGVWIGAALHYGGPLVGALRAIDQYVVAALSDADHVKIIVFSMLLGGMVGVLSRGGGTRGLIEALTPYATSSVRGQVVCWAMGLLIFFDDYANTLLVGNTMRPVTDRLRVSREKLAYIVDSTAAPVASLFLVSTWIGYQVSLIGDGLSQAGVAVDGYSLFLQSLPFNFYPILALLFVILIASTGRDFGPMLAAERRAAQGQLIAVGAQPLAEVDDPAFEPEPDKPRRWINGLVPIVVVLIVAFAALWITGRTSLREAGSPLAETGIFGLGLQGLGAVLGGSASYDALLYASLSGCLVAIALVLGQRILNLNQSIAAWGHGIKSMTPAMLILTLAWSISAVCSDLGTAGYLSGLLQQAGVGAAWLPLIIFVLAAVIAFSTGSSWATMGLIIPISIQTVVDLTSLQGITSVSGEPVLLASVSAVLAGAIFGDHCSPISDTTVMSSMASGCDHVDHVRTQLPYALTVAGAAILLGYIPVGFGLPPVIGLLLGSAALFGVVRWLGRPAIAT